MGQYLMSVWHDDEYELDFSSEEAQREVAQVGRFNADLEAAGVWVFAGGLQPASSATVVSPADGEVSMTDGPCADKRDGPVPDHGRGRPRGCAGVGPSCRTSR